MNIFPKGEIIAFEKPMLLRPEVCLSSLQLLRERNSGTGLTGATRYEGHRSGEFQGQGWDSPWDLFVPREEFGPGAVPDGTCRVHSALGLLLQRQTFWKVLWSGAQARLLVHRLGRMAAL